MASQPKWRAFCARMATEPGAEDQVFDMLSDGATVREVAERFNTSRSQMYRWITYTEDRKARYAACKLEGAAALNEETKAIADAPLGVLASPQEVQLRKLQIEVRARLAGQLDPKLADKPSGGNTIINIEHMHLDALRQRGGPDVAPPLPPSRGPAPQLEAPVDAEWALDDEPAPAREVQEVAVV